MHPSTGSSSLSETFLPPLASMPLHRRKVRTTAAEPGVRGHVLSDVLFRDALVRERRRADRFEETFVVALVSRDGHGALTSDWDRIVRALSTDTFRGDLLGWLEAGTILGLIRSTGPGDAADGVAAAEAMRRDLHQCLIGDLEDCSVRIETYDPAGRMTPQWLIAGRDRPSTAADLARDAGKRALDIAGSAALLLMLTPLILCIALMIKGTSPGPVFFRQQRVGAGGRLFHMIKFRSMRLDADPSIHKQYVESFIKAGAERPEGGETVCKIVNDPRVTPIGHFLRRSSLDEVPQFWNVLVGEMSLVGPRPPLPYEVARYKSWHRRRVLEAKPGITGLWQVTGRSRTTFDEMVRLDLRYARNYGVWTDVKILLATPKAVLSGKGAH